MRQSELDQINASLDRTEFTVKELRKKVDELHCKAAPAIRPLISGWSPIQNMGRLW
jgi:hypothetical protein